MLRIEARNLIKKFDDFIAVDNVSLEIKKGEIFGLLGANGAGKTTTIKMLRGILQPTSGFATIAGYDLYKEAELIKRKIGYMSQKFTLYEDLTVEENLRFFGSIYGLTGKTLSNQIDWTLTTVGLFNEKKYLTSSLPVGIKQRLALAAAVIHKPEIIFLDEPTSGVDPYSRSFFWNLINDFAEDNAAIIVTTHYLDEAEYCSRLAIMNKGKIICEGSPSELKKIDNKFKFFEISNIDFDLAEKALSPLDFIFDMSFFGSKIHLATVSSQLDYVYLKDLLTRLFPNANIKLIAPSIEDIFIVSLKQNEKDFRPN